MDGTTTRTAARFLGIAGVVAGAIAIIAAVAGDHRVEVTWGLAVVAVALFVMLIGALVADYRPMTAGIVMLVGVLAIVVGQWNEISRWTVDLWTSGTGGPVSYVYKGVTYQPDFWRVLFGSVGMLGYAGTVILGTIGGFLALFAPEPAAEFRPAPRPAAL